MYTAISVTRIGIEKPSKWKVDVSESSDEQDLTIFITYRYGILIAQIADEILYKNRLTTDITDGAMSWRDFIQYQEQYFPEEMIDFSLIKTVTNEPEEV